MTSQVAWLDYSDEDRTLKLGGVVSTLPEEETPSRNSTAECLVHPNGKFLFVSNRGHNSIAVFMIDNQSGMLSRVGNTATDGDVPRGFGIDPSGKFLVVGNQNSGSVVSLAINPDTGELRPTGNSIAVSKPVNIRFFSQ